MKNSLALTVMLLHAAVLISIDNVNATPEGLVVRTNSTDKAAPVIPQDMHPGNEHWVAGNTNSRRTRLPRQAFWCFPENFDFNYPADVDVRCALLMLPPRPSTTPTPTTPSPPRRSTTPSTTRPTTRPRRIKKRRYTTTPSTTRPTKRPRRIKKIRSTTTPSTTRPTTRPRRIKKIRKTTQRPTASYPPYQQYPPPHYIPTLPPRPPPTPARSTLIAGGRCYYW